MNKVQREPAQNMFCNSNPFLPPGELKGVGFSTTEKLSKPEKELREPAACYQPSLTKRTVWEKPPPPTSSPYNFLHLQFQNPAVILIREAPNLAHTLWCVSPKPHQFSWPVVAARNLSGNLILSCFSMVFCLIINTALWKSSHTTVSVELHFFETQLCFLGIRASVFSQEPGQAQLPRGLPQKAQPWYLKPRGPQIIGLQTKFSCWGLIRNCWVSFFLSRFNCHPQALWPCFLSFSGPIPGKWSLQIPTDYLGGLQSFREKR